MIDPMNILWGTFAALAAIAGPTVVRDLWDRRDRFCVWAFPGLYPNRNCSRCGDLLHSVEDRVNERCQTCREAMQ